MIGKDEARGTWFVQIKIKDPVSGKQHGRKSGDSPPKEKQSCSKLR